MTRPRLFVDMHWKLLLLAISILLPVVLVEFGLRAAGFSFDLAPSNVEFGFPDPAQITRLYEPDPDLFWVTRNYYKNLQRFDSQTPHLDIVFIGDSVSEPRLARYPRMFGKLVRARPNRSDFAGLALGVSGWTSHQGLIQLTRHVIPMQPRVVTILYGWNDHWLAYGIDDAAITRLTSAGTFLHALRESRVVQLGFKVSLSRGRGERESWPYRVSLAQYRSNLEEMVDRTRRAGIVPVLITAPDAHIEGSEPSYLVLRWLVEGRQLIPLHQSYLNVVRDVAREREVILCDLAEAFDGIPIEERVDWFMDDGVHLLKAGDRFFANTLLACFDSEPEIAGIVNATATVESVPD